MLNQVSHLATNVVNGSSFNNSNSLPNPKPFVKWVGGKRQLLDLLQDEMPQEFNNYFEPFIGGGALFFSTMPEKAFISDMNAELINCYQVIRRDIDALIDTLQTHINNETYFYALRKMDISQLSEIERAARFIYLNKTCFNGLYRENKKSQFNVPYGSYKNPKIVDEENLLSVSHYLNESNIVIEHADFESIYRKVRAGDFVYFDPPYVPITATASFTAYTAQGFTNEDQLALAKLCRRLDKKGAYIMVSNSNSPLVHDLYQGFKIKEIFAKRSINCKGNSRAKQKNEVLITNY